MSIREIAALTGVPENTVKSRLNYGCKTRKDGFLSYENDGIKLYSVSPLPFLLALLRGAAQSQANPAAAAEALEAPVVTPENCPSNAHSATTPPPSPRMGTQ